MATAEPSLAHDAQRQISRRSCSVRPTRVLFHSQSTSRRTCRGPTTCSVGGKRRRNHGWTRRHTAWRWRKRRLRWRLRWKTDVQSMQEPYFKHHHECRRRRTANSAELKILAIQKGRVVLMAGLVMEMRSAYEMAVKFNDTNSQAVKRIKNGKRWQRTSIICPSPSRRPSCSRKVARR